MDKGSSVTKYMTLYMCLGMCYGMSAGLILGIIFFPENMFMGMGFGVPIGMCVGIALGSIKDKRLSENMMTISRIQTIDASSDIMIYAIDKKQIEHEYRITEKKMKSEKYRVNDRVAEESDGSLVLLENR